MIDEPLVEEIHRLIRLRLVLDGGEQQRIEHGMPLLDETRDFAVAPKIAASFEIRDQADRDDRQQTPAIRLAGNGMPLHRREPDATAHEQPDEKRGEPYKADRQ